MELLAAFRAMNGRSQAFIVRLADAQAVRCPHRVAPLLRLVESGHAKG
ncbi:hypothetical protein [Massilia eurypsychrophila]|nr:hypothetical protein [Massilia eurypsychrophila]